MIIARDDDANPFQIDTDIDDLGDACDTDDDNDGCLDSEDDYPLIFSDNDDDLDGNANLIIIYL